MSTGKIKEVSALVADVLNLSPDAVGPAASTENLPQWDSLAHLQICLAFQERYGVSLSMEAIASATSVVKLAELLP